MTSNRSLLLLGCGYLGTVVAERVPAAYEQTYAYVSAPTPRPRLKKAGAQVHAVDIFCESLGLPADDRRAKHAMVLLPPSRIPDEPGVIATLSSKLDEIDCKRAVLISSTGVYAASETAVTAETTVYSDTPRATRLHRIETEWLQASPRNVILRLAGIYGPDRVVGLETLRKGDAVGGDADAWLNLIHVEDAAALALSCLNGAGARIELGADGNPVKRHAYYGHLAALRGLPLPKFAGEAERNTQSKRCDPSTSFRRLNFEPRFPDYKSGLAHALAAIEE